MQLTLVQAQGADSEAPAVQDQQQKIHAAMMQNMQQLQQLEQAMAATMVRNDRHLIFAPFLPSRLRQRCYHCPAV